MRYNLNAGWGPKMVNRLATNQSGKVFVVGKAALANRQNYQELFSVDNDGVDRFFATVDAAFASCTASAGDTIYVLPGHTETVTATSIAHDVAGVSVIGLGEGTMRPTFTFGAAAATITVTGANGSWENCHFVANYDNVASAFTIGAAVNFRLENCTAFDTTNALHFYSIVTTGATDNEADGLVVRGNNWESKALAALAFVSILAAEKNVVVEDNDVFMLATNDVGHFITLAAKNVTNGIIRNNTLVVTGATNATVGIFLTGSGTSTGLIADNVCASLDTTTELMFTTGTGFKFFRNLYTGTADASGKLLPAIDG